MLRWTAEGAMYTQWMTKIWSKESLECDRSGECVEAVLDELLQGNAQSATGTRLRNQPDRIEIKVKLLISEIDRHVRRRRRRRRQTAGDEPRRFFVAAGVVCLSAEFTVIHSAVFSATPFNTQPRLSCRREKHTHQ